MFRGQGEIDRLRGGAHGEEKTAIRHVIADRPGNRTLQGRHVAEPQALRRVGIHLHHFGEPRFSGMSQGELRALTGEVFMVQVQPVVARQRAAHHLEVPDLVERDARVLERHRHRIVPRGCVGRDVHGNFGRLLERNGVRIHRPDRPADGRDVVYGDGLHPRTGEPCVAPDRRTIGDQERPAPIVEQPLRLQSGLDDAIGRRTL
jgi:hypothetical protein